MMVLFRGGSQTCRPGRFGVLLRHFRVSRDGGMGPHGGRMGLAAVPFASLFSQD